MHASGIAYANNIVLQSNSYRAIEGLLEAVEHYAAAGMCIKATKTKVMSAFIGGE